MGSMAMGTAVSEKPPYPISASLREHPEAHPTSSFLLPPYYISTVTLKNCDPLFVGVYHESERVVLPQMV